MWVKSCLGDKCSNPGTIIEKIGFLAVVSLPENLILTISFLRAFFSLCGLENESWRQVYHVRICRKLKSMPPVF